VNLASKDKSKRKRIGDLMVSQNLISSEMLTEALKIQKTEGGKIVDVLIQAGHLTITDFVNFLSRQPGVASIDLDHYQISKEIIGLLPIEMVVANEVFPIDKMGSLLTLGMVCPLDSKTIEEIETITGLRVKPILCSPVDIRGAIKRYYPSAKIEGMTGDESIVPDEETIPDVEPNAEEEVTAPKVESGLRLGNVVRMIRGLKTLPALPNTVTVVKEAMEDIHASPNEVAQKIILDPPIAAKVLSVANSSAYGFSNRVDSVELAVALLGLRETYSIVLSAAVMNLFEATKSFNYKSYWEEAMNAAAACRLIAQVCGRGADKSMFTAGLLHDIGRIALLETEPDRYKGLDSKLHGNELVNSEQELFGLSHAEAGYELAMNWNLPQEIAEAIRFHHTPEFSEIAPAHVHIVSLAEKWSHQLAFDSVDKNEIIRDSKVQLQKLLIDESTAAWVFDEIAQLDRVHFSWGGE
jgi:putative nucleotidyltransferase with HDIG domain